jgi:lysophospholipase L1-like esterase/pimeloyl-ACP methyl ester carboxylesterase
MLQRMNGKLYWQTGCNNFNMMKLISTIGFLFCCCLAMAQVTSWDDTQTKNWPMGFDRVDIASSADGSLQPCILHKSAKPNQPLIVSLHSWSGDYAQADSISWEIAERDWNYIHPHFRGPNWSPQACGSAFVVKDIEDAINYALKETNANPSEVHIIGASGGGHAAMLCFLQIQVPVKSVSAWVGISNLEDWYHESVSRGQRYAKDILKATGDTTKLSVDEARKRSPFFIPYSKTNWSRQLFLYAGIHDGYNGSVPITQTLNFYNKVVKELYPGTDNVLVSQEEMLELVVKRSFPSQNLNKRLGDRKVHYFKSTGNVSVNIFEGKHEQVVKTVMALLPIELRQVNKPMNILCIGDSNGEIKDGWVTQLQFELPSAFIINKCRSGNTIGFDNGGSPALNQLKNTGNDLQNAAAAIGDKHFDYVIISLGTNDTKREFNKQQKEIAKNLERLIQQIRNSGLPQYAHAKMIVVSPPPIAADEVFSKNILEKFAGAGRRMGKLLPRLEAVAKKQNCIFIESNTLLKQRWNQYSYDGIHYTAAGAQVVARAIGTWLNKGE